MSDQISFLGKEFCTEEEIAELRWVQIGNAASWLAYDNDRQLVNRVKAYLALSKV